MFRSEMGDPKANAKGQQILAPAELARAISLALSDKRESGLMQAAQKGELIEAFGTGTAAVISPVGELASKNWKVKINDGKMGELTTKLYQELTEIQYGAKPDTLNWIEKLT